MKRSIVVAYESLTKRLALVPRVHQYLSMARARRLKDLNRKTNNDRPGVLNVNNNRLSTIIRSKHQ